MIHLLCFFEMFLSEIFVIVHNLHLFILQVVLESYKENFQKDKRGMI